MNILFLTLVEISSIEERGIYQDLLRKFRDEGHDITIVSAVERRRNIPTNLKNREGVSILQVKTCNIQKTNVLEKGIGTLLVDYQYKKAVNKYLSHQQFDLILYTTPPITLIKTIEYVKNRDNASTYLLLKDIFPQNAVDMRMMKKGSFLYNIFRRKEKRLYALSDVIGCMSPANKKYVLEHNVEISESRVEVNPNTIAPVHIEYSDEQKVLTRNAYGLPLDKKIFIYGGNLGKPQGIDFLLETILNTQREDVFFLIVGTGTEYQKISMWFQKYQPKNAKLCQGLPKSDFDMLLASCDVGLIFLDSRFTIPNFPSRLLSYLEMRMPVLAATDASTDVGDILEQAKCGFKVLSGDQNEMQKKIDSLMASDFQLLSQNSYRLLMEHYLVDASYKLIMNRMVKSV